MNEQELAELDLAVAKTEGWKVIEPQGECAPFVGEMGRGDMRRYSPTRDHAEAMRLLEKHELTLMRWDDETSLPWRAGDASCTMDGMDWENDAYGETPCIAICKAVVALKR